MKFKPCIDLHEGKVKQIVGSTLGGEVKTNFSASQEATAFADKFEKYNGGHICILDREETTLEQAFSVLKKYPNTWQVGGGIDEKTAKKYLTAGADKVIVSSALFSGPDIYERAKELAEKIGRENLVLDLSCKSFDETYYVMKDGWRTKTNLEVSVKNLEKLSAFCAEFLVHGVSVEGKNAGFDRPLVKILTEFKDHNAIPITYAGGLHNLEDLKSFEAISARRLDFTIGSSLDIYGGNLSLDEILNLTKM